MNLNRTQVRENSTLSDSQIEWMTRFNLNLTHDSIWIMSSNYDNDIILHIFRLNDVVLLMSHKIVLWIWATNLNHAFESKTRVKSILFRLKSNRP